MATLLNIIVKAALETFLGHDGSSKGRSAIIYTSSVSAINSITKDRTSWKEPRRMTPAGSGA